MEYSMAYDHVVLALVLVALVASFLGAIFCGIRDSRWFRHWKSRRDFQARYIRAKRW